MENQTYVPEKKTSGVCIAALVCGIVAILGCCNPLYLVSLAAIILGIIGLSGHKNSKGMAIAGLILGIISIIIWPILDTIVTILSGGLGFLSYFI